MTFTVAQVADIARIEAVPSILEVICRTTGMGFAAIASVSEDRWIACAVRDEINFGLQPGEEFRVGSTSCKNVPFDETMVLIDRVDEDAADSRHPIPASYGVQSYISVPIFYADGRRFGTLCAIDRKPAQLDRPEIIKMFGLFADLLTFHLSAARTGFSVQLEGRLQTATTPEDIIASACELLGRSLGVKRAVYGEVDESGRYVFMRRDWTADGVASVAGSTKVMTHFGPELIAALNIGEVIVNEDVTLHPYTAHSADAYKEVGVRAEMLFPLVKDGKLRLILALHHDRPYSWSSEEIDCARDMAERAWLAVDAARAQAELRAERDQSQSIFDNMIEGFGLMDRNWTIIRMNAAGLELVQRTEEAVVGRNHWEVFPETLGTDIETLSRAAKDERIAGVTEYPYKLPDGQIRWMEVGLYPVLGDSVATFFRDVTSRKRAEEILQTEAQRKDEFLAMLAHELRNPLAPIGAAAELLQIAELDEAKVRRTSSIIARQVRHMSHLIDDLLDVSRVARGLVTLAKVPVDMRQIVADALEQVRPLIDAKGHRLSIQISPDPAIVIGDGKRLVQIVANLLNNAVKYTPDRGEIAIRLDVDMAQVCVEVRDTGIGMPPDLVNHVFDLFTQAERTSDRSTGGLGIGLAIVKSLLGLHGGSVSCDSEGPGKGSRFVVRLPRLAGSGEQTSDRLASQNRTAAFRSLKILVVDDNQDAAAMLGMLLETAGHQVLIEHDSRRALELAARTKPDACLIDIGLPDMDGNELAERLRAQDKTAKSTLVAVTGYGQESDRKRALAAGFDHHLVKPVDISKLFAILAEI